MIPKHWERLMDEYQAAMGLAIDYQRTPRQAVDELHDARKKAGRVMIGSMVPEECADALQRLQAATSAITRRE